MNRELANLSGFDFGIEDHGFPVLTGTFHLTETYSAVGCGYIVDVAFLIRFLGVFGVERLQEVNRKSCWLVFEEASTRISRIEPLHKGAGRAFDVAAWSAYKPGASAHELLTRVKP